ncbi:hypothetical protein C8J57DRAFT_1434452 [Mycena rebaudengoi]|nr:hypothetical protein C8J57DRAFT_1434452 [Mycena rebaudengoi]
MREQHVGVLIVGEAHMTDERKSNIDALFARCMRLEFTKDPISDNSAGIAFVLNKNLVETENIKTTEVVAGRALLLEMKNVDGSPLSILGVYAPNAPSDNAAFWRTIKAWFMARPRVRKPEFMGGDMNRGTRRPKKVLWNDGRVRETYPSTCAYTYHQTIAQGASQSRVDRFYVKTSLFKQTFEWGMQTAGINTDHRMVTVRLTTENAPTLGHGRWVWPAYLIKDKTLSEFVDNKGQRLCADLEAVARRPAREADYNAQTLWARFKDEIDAKARHRAKVMVPKIVQEIAEVETKLDLILANKDLTEDERKLTSVTLVEKLVQLQKQRYRASRLST